MRPLRRFDISRTAAKKLGLDHKFVDDIIKDYYAHATKKMTKLEHLKYDFPGLGTFSIMGKAIESRIKRQEYLIRMAERGTFENVVRQTDILEALKDILFRFENEKEQRKYFKQKGMKGTLIEIWKNKNEIFEGIKNNIFKNEHVEEIANARLKICRSCDKYDTKGVDCAIIGTAPCCSECGCSMKLKARSLSTGCPLGKWEEILTEQEEEALLTNLQQV